MDRAESANRMFCPHTKDVTSRAWSRNEDALQCRLIVLHSRCFMCGWRSMLLLTCRHSMLLRLHGVTEWNIRVFWRSVSHWFCICPENRSREIPFYRDPNLHICELIYWILYVSNIVLSWCFEHVWTCWFASIIGRFSSMTVVGCQMVEIIVKCLKRVVDSPCCRELLMRASSMPNSGHTSWVSWCAERALLSLICCLDHRGEMENWGNPLSRLEVLLTAAALNHILLNPHHIRNICECWAVCLMSCGRWRLPTSRGSSKMCTRCLCWRHCSCMFSCVEWWALTVLFAGSGAPTINTDPVHLKLISPSLVSHFVGLPGSCMKNKEKRWVHDTVSGVQLSRLTMLPIAEWHRE